MQPQSDTHPHARTHPPRPPTPRPQTYEIDFVSLSYTRCSEDVIEAREFLDSVGLGATKIFAKMESRQVGPPRARAGVCGLRGWSFSARVAPGFSRPKIRRLALALLGASSEGCHAPVPRPSPTPRRSCCNTPSQTPCKTPPLASRC
jgi:hypothetical protein